MGVLELKLVITGAAGAESPVTVPVNSSRT